MNSQLPLFFARPRAKIKSGQALHGTRRTSLPLLPSGPGGVHAPAHAWHLADAHHARRAPRRNYYLRCGGDSVRRGEIGANWNRALPSRPLLPALNRRPGGRGLARAFVLGLLALAL